MIIDIRAHLRRLVLATSPLLGACAGYETCSPMDVFIGSSTPGRNATTVTVRFDPESPGLPELREDCWHDQRLCQTYCTEIANRSGLTASGFSPVVTTCRLGCNAGGDWATLSFIPQPTPPTPPPPTPPPPTPPPPTPPPPPRPPVPPVPGRRCEGSSLCVPQAPGTTAGAWALACAEAEADSVIAFERLARELRAHGAPADLTDRARQAVRDEARHTRRMASLARHLGGMEVPPAGRRAGRLPVRSLEEVARENAREGCVGETFAAAVALWQASRARDPLVRQTMVEIASDEAGHAQLAWDIDDWARQRLTAAAASAVLSEREAAGAALTREAGQAVDAALVEAVGLPPAVMATHLARQLHAGLWSPPPNRI